MTIQDLIIIFNLFIIEALLSVDNATALAAMVKHLPEVQQKKALRYGLFGAYAFRGLCLFFVAWLIKIIWLKIVGGLYLLYLTYDFFKGKADEENGEKKIVAKGMWATIVAVEIMDLSLSIDNVFAAVALSNKFWVIMTGVAIGILAMRFVAGWFVKLINKYPSLESSAFIVIALLGLKLIVSGILEYIPSMRGAKDFMEGHAFGFTFSAAMMLIFFVSIVASKAEDEPDSENEKIDDDYHYPVDEHLKYL